MNQFATARTFQPRPSTFKKKLALIAFVLGATSFTLAITKVVGTNNGAYFFAGGITAMALAFRFWSMQVHNPMAVTFAESGITIAQGSTIETIPWPDLEFIRYKIWRGGHYWQFKQRERKSTFDFYVDGLTSGQLEELRQAVASINLPGVAIETVNNPFDAKSEALFAISDAVRRATR